MPRADSEFWDAEVDDDETAFTIIAGVERSDTDGLAPAEACSARLTTSTTTIVSMACLQTQSRTLGAEAERKRHREIERRARPTWGL
jgi:hypothetical protein